jgi:hypothetical protein
MKHLGNRSSTEQCDFLQGTIDPQDLLAMSDALRKNGLTLMQTLMVEGDVAGVKALLSYARTTWTLCL